VQPPVPGRHRMVGEQANKVHTGQLGEGGGQLEQVCVESVPGGGEYGPVPMRDEGVPHRPGQRDRVQDIAGPGPCRRRSQHGGELVQASGQRLRHPGHVQALPVGRQEVLLRQQAEHGIGFRLAGVAGRQIQIERAVPARGHVGAHAGRDQAGDEHGSQRTDRAGTEHDDPGRYQVRHPFGQAVEQPASELDRGRITDLGQRQSNPRVRRSARGHGAAQRLQDLLGLHALLPVSAAGSPGAPQIRNSVHAQCIPLPVLVNATRSPGWATPCSSSRLSAKTWSAQPK
jgi:hypothetical protein